MTFRFAAFCAAFRRGGRSTALSECPFESSVPTGFLPYSNEDVGTSPPPMPSRRRRSVNVGNDEFKCNLFNDMGGNSALSGVWRWSVCGVHFRDRLVTLLSGNVSIQLQPLFSRYGFELGMANVNYANHSKVMSTFSSGVFWLRICRGIRSILK